MQSVQCMCGGIPVGVGRVNAGGEGWVGYMEEGDSRFPRDRKEKPLALASGRVWPGRGPRKGSQRMWGQPGRRRNDRCATQGSLRLSQGTRPVQSIYPDTHNFTNYPPRNIRSAKKPQRNPQGRVQAHLKCLPLETGVGVSQVPGQPELQGKTLPPNNQPKQPANDQPTRQVLSRGSRLLASSVTL
jgi:hypothetical protein